MAWSYVVFFLENVVFAKIYKIANFSDHNNMVKFTLKAKKTGLIISTREPSLQIWAGPYNLWDAVYR